VSVQQKIRILILGGGFAGLHAAMHLDETLARDPGIEITLVNRDNFKRLWGTCSR
jgi:NADH dehydrogenase FAD-containing subunit